MSSAAITWLGITFCISQSALFSGLNLAVFGVSRLRLEVEAATGDRNAQRVLGLRRDANLVLTTILWGNVGINVLLTLLSDSILTGVGAFFFSTLVITYMGEIVPQAYFSRNAMKMASLLTPVLNLYKLLLYPVVKPTALALDRWLGPEGIHYFREQDLKELIRRHIGSDTGEIDRLEGIGAMNFLSMDDLLVSQEGELINPESIIELPVRDGRAVFPDFQKTMNDPFLGKIQASGEKWVTLVDSTGDPFLVVDSDQFIREALFSPDTFDPHRHCHRPIIVRDLKTPLGKVVTHWKPASVSPCDDVIDNDIVLIWEGEKRIITGADILGRLLLGFGAAAGTGGIAGSLDTTC
ncbi:DUF21 domain-containing protein [bacterium]|nr:DUF21 domain-containing protein [bacterium]